MSSIYNNLNNINDFQHNIIKKRFKNIIYLIPIYNYKCGNSVQFLINKEFSICLA